MFLTLVMLSHETVAFKKVVYFNKVLTLGEVGPTSNQWQTDDGFWDGRSQKADVLMRRTRSLVPSHVLLLQEEHGLCPRHAGTRRDSLRPEVGD